MGKRLITTILAIIFSFLMVVISFAENNKADEINNTLNIEQLKDDKDRDSIANTVESRFKDIKEVGNKLKWSKTPEKNGQYYKIYILKDNIKKFKVQNGYDKYLSSNAIWETPILSSEGEIVSVMGIYKNGNIWSTSEGHSMPIDFVKFYTDPANIKKILDDNKIVNPKFVKHIRIRELYTDFFYIQGESGEYAIPLANNPEELAIKNFSLYKMVDFWDKLSIKYVNPENSKNHTGTADAQFGGSKASASNYSVYFIIALSLFVVSLAIMLFLRRKSILDINKR